MRATDKSVRDHSVRARIEGDKVVVEHYFAGKRCERIMFARADWPDSALPGGPWEQRCLVDRLRPWSEDDPGELHVWDRLGDSIGNAINKVLTARIVEEHCAETARV